MNLNTETQNWISFIETLIENNYDVYVKGGSVTGLHILKLIKESQFGDFLKLNLIKDWDFTIFTSDQSTITQLANQYNILVEGKTIIVLRQQNHIKIEAEALFELSIKEKEHICDLELPISTMKIKITKDNIHNLFNLSKLFYLKETNYQELINLTNNLIIDIPYCQDGYFIITQDTYDCGNISAQLTDIIKSTTKNINKQQFLITHFIQPDRLFHRLNKNKIKSQNIEPFIGKTDWILNISKTDKLINKFLSLLQKSITIIFNQLPEQNPEEEYIKSIIKTFTETNTLFQNCNINRLVSLYKTFSDNPKQQIKMLMPNIEIIRIDNYLCKIIKKKATYKQLHKIGYYNLFRLLL